MSPINSHTSTERVAWRDTPPDHGAMWNAVAQLSQNQRAVFLLRFVEEMEILEIAAATGLKEGTVKIHLFRALRSVRTRMTTREDL